MARGRARMRKNWQDVVASGQTVATTTQAVIASIGLIETAQADQTLLRSRGELIADAAPNATSDSDVLGVGLIVVHSNAVTAGGVSLPGPISDAGADWLWHNFVCLGAGGTTSGADPSNVLSKRIVPIDSKAMRRFPADHEVALMIQLSSGDFASVLVTAGMRLLFGF